MRTIRSTRSLQKNGLFLLFFAYLARFGIFRESWEKNYGFILKLLILTLIVRYVRKKLFFFYRVAAARSPRLTIVQIHQSDIVFNFFYVFYLFILLFYLTQIITKGIL